MGAIVKKILAGAVAVSLLLAAAAALILWTEWLSRISNPLVHGAAAVAELAGGAAILLGALYVATQTAVRIFARREETGAVALPRGE
ncbi:MAG: hypothetical protein ACLP1Y_09440 [Candidatus Acidiferrales bacterium]